MCSPSDADIVIFKEWLRKHGANFEKIEWPSADTNSGIRGAVALDDIATDEFMVTIPVKLMISPESAFSDPIAGEMFTKNIDILRGDLLLTIYLTYELSKGEDSFYYPYLKILPEPGSISKWSDAELEELQHEQLKHRAERKRSQIKIVYDGLMTALNARCPGFFVPHVFTIDRFCFSFDTIQARAFGRRLPWTALVPFADCLNHGNLQTKYSFDDQERVFRLFPTGGNSYDRGCEVFNSYGRRPNDNLLLDYGFSMMDNEWDEVVVLFKLPLDEANFDRKVKVLRSYGEYYSKKISLNFCYMPEHVMSYFRVAEASLCDLDSLEKMKKTEDSIDRPLHLYNERTALHRLRGILASNLTRAHSTSEEEDTVKLSFLRDELAGAGTETEIEAGTGTGTEGAGVEVAGGATGDDSAEDGRWKLLCALTYRITRKKILKNAVLLLEELCDWIDKIIANKNQDTNTFDVATPVEMYESISRFYPLPELSSDSKPVAAAAVAAGSKPKLNPSYDKSAGKATPFITLAYLNLVRSLPLDAIVLPAATEIVEGLQAGVQSMGVGDVDKSFLHAKEK